MTPFPIPKGGASLLLSFRPVKKTVLIVGSGPLAASRAFAALEADAVVVILAKGGLEAACEELRWRAQQAQLTIYDLDATSSRGGLSELETIEKLISRESTISLVCVTDTILGGNSTDPEQVRSYAQDIYRTCSALNIPVNITDIPELCDFSFASTHRFLDPITGEKTALQIGVTTNGKGCRLAGRLRRDIVSRLPKEAGSAVETVGALRVLAKSEARKDIADDEDAGASTPNRPVAQRQPPEAENTVEKARRRMRWVSQVSEYWPIERLGRMSETEMQEVMSPGGAELAHQQHIIPNSAAVSPPSLHSLTISPTQPLGKILLVGSGPGLPSLLTLAAHTALTKQAQLVLSDKLVPASVLALIPPGVEVRIARKFPGNADSAQEELMEAAVEAARQGKVVVRLKQGDPAVYGRVGEEILYFRSHGFDPVVIPGVSSVLAGPTFAGISVTQRGAAESFIVCTGVGRKGKDVRLPGYEREKTVIMLMAVARIGPVVASLLHAGKDSRRNGEAYPSHVPIAIIERASMPDQRVLETTLGNVESVLESLGEQRPPGMLVIGWAVLALWGEGDVRVLDEAEEEDLARVCKWLGGSGARWRVREGLTGGWEDI